MSNRSAFSLIETMVAGAILGLISATVLATMSFATEEVTRTRTRTLAAADAQAQLDRMVTMSTVVKFNDTQRCSLFQAAGAPMDTTTGGTVTGACPLVTGANLTVANIPIPSSTLARTVSLTAQNLGNIPGLLVVITVDGADLPSPVFIRTHVKR